MTRSGQEFKSKCFGTISNLLTRTLVANNFSLPCASNRHSPIMPLFLDLGALSRYFVTI